MNFWTIVKWGPFIWSIAKPTIDLVNEIESAITEPGAGEKKKAAVLSRIANLYDAGRSKWGSVPKEYVLNIAGGLIDIIVAIYNFLGIFKHSK